MNLMMRAIWSLHSFKSLSIGVNAKISFLSVRRGAECHLLVGQSSIVGSRLAFDRPGARITIGARTFIGKSLIVASKEVSIGDDVLISWGVTIVDHASHSIDAAEREHDVINWGGGSKDWSNVPSAPVRIGNKVWVGFGAALLKGITIGEGAVIGAHAVVTRDVEPWTVVAGNPARIIKQLKP